MGIFITKQADVKAYHDNPAINQSSLKNLEKGLGSFLGIKAKREKEKREGTPKPEHFLIGRAVDLLLTGDPTEFVEEYYVSKVTKLPSEKEVLIIDVLVQSILGCGLTPPKSLGHTSILPFLNKVITDQAWYNGNPGPKRIEGLLTRCSDYYQDLALAGGRDILSQEQFDKIKRIVKSLETNDRTKKYFDRAEQLEATRFDFYYQLPIYFTQEGEECKALMDMVVVCRDITGNIQWIDPIDLKTMSGYTLEFLSSLKKRRYDIQAAWYVEALAEHFKVNRSAIRGFKFIVESTTNIGNPLVYELSTRTLNIGKFGIKARLIKTLEGEEVYFKPIKGYVQYLEEYIQYMETSFREDIILSNNPGALGLDWERGIL